MPITESLGALGQWTLQLKDSTPRAVRDAIQYFGHITVHTGRVQPELVGDGLLASSRYTGVLRGKGENDEGFSLSGCGMEFWLGDEDDKGVIIEDPLTFTAQTYTQTIRDLIAMTGSVTEGTFHAVAGTYTGTHQFQVLRKAIAYVASTGGIEYRVNGDATLDVGTEAELYVTDPKCLVVKRGAGVDMDLRALLGQSTVGSDTEDFTTRVVLLAQSTDTQVATGDADIDPGLNPYKDLHGNPIKLTRMVSESTTDSTNATARAQLQLNRFSGTRDALTLSTTEYDINGSARIGDYIWVFNPDIQLEDQNNQVTFRGQVMNPVKIRLIKSTWPVSEGFMVAYRDLNGVWRDLTDYVVWEGGQTTLEVGGYNRSLVGSSSEPIGRLPQPDSSVPDVVTWNTPFRVGVYQSQVTGSARGDVILSWNTPNNTDSTPIVDGSHYEIRYRSATVPFYPATWDQVVDEYGDWDTWSASGATWDNPIVYPATEWQTAVAPFDTTVFRLQELIPGSPYEAQIRAVDLATPSNRGDWSSLALWQTTDDNIPPATPAPPEVQANPLAVLMTHRLGVASGGTFNLDSDLHHLELHGEYEPLFTPTDDTLLGKVPANYGMIIGNVPVVAKFPITNTEPVYFKVVAVDEAGNRSLPSVAVQETADLLPAQYIESITAGQIESGTVTADLIVGGSIATGNEFSFPRVEMNSFGLRGLSSGGLQLWSADNDSGKIMVTGTGGIEINDGRLVVKNASGTKTVELGECADGRHGLQIYKDDGTRVVRIGELASGAEGIEVIDDTGNLVRVDTLAFGTRAASVATQESTSSSSYTNLATVGPQVTVPIGNSGRCVVILSGRMNGPGTDVMNASIGFDMSGPAGYFRAAGVFESQWVALSNSAGNMGVNISLSKAVLVSGLPYAGNYTLQMKYWTNGTSHSFADRHIIAVPF